MGPVPSTIVPRSYDNLKSRETWDSGTGISQFGTEFA